MYKIALKKTNNGEDYRNAIDVTEIACAPNTALERLLEVISNYYADVVPGSEVALPEELPNLRSIDASSFRNIARAEVSDSSGVAGNGAVNISYLCTPDKTYTYGSRPKQVPDPNVDYPTAGSFGMIELSSGKQTHRTFPGKRQFIIWVNHPDKGISQCIASGLMQHILENDSFAVDANTYDIR